MTNFRQHMLKTGSEPSEQKNILLVAPFTILPGEKGFNRFIYIAEQLSERGHKVTLVTSRFKHSDKQFRDQADVDQLAQTLPYKIVLIDEQGYVNNIGLARIRSHRKFSLELKKYLSTLLKQPDIIYCAYPMMGAAYVTGKYAKNKQIPFVLDVQDIWPEAIKNTIPFPEKITDCLLFPLTVYANRIYRLADYIVGVSESYVARAKRVNRHAKSYLPIFIGTDLGFFDHCKKSEIYKGKNEFWITYIGTISYSYDLETVIRAVAAVEKRNDMKIVFKVFGSGPLMGKYQSLAQQLNAPVDFMGHYTYEEMIPYLVRSDIAANAIAKGAQQSITNKIGDFLSAGLPILNSSLNEEFKKMVTEWNIGYSYLPGDDEQLANFIEQLVHQQSLRTRLGHNARILAEEQFDRRQTYGKIYQLIEKATI